MLMRRTILFSPAFVLSGNSCNCTFSNLMVASYVNQEYSVRGKSITFKYTCLFADFCDLFSHHSRTKIVTSVVRQFSVNEEKSSSHEQVLIKND